MKENILDIQHKKVIFQPLKSITWLLIGLCFLLIGVGLFLLFQPDNPQHPEYRIWESILQYVAALVVVSIGTLIIRRYPRHPIGWLFNVIALLLALDLFAYSYAAYSLIGNPGSLPFAVIMAEIADDLSFIIQYVLILVLLLFPNGRFLSVRWRIFALIIGLAIVYANIIWLLEPGSLYEFPGVINPFGISRNLHSVLRPHANFISTYFLPVSLVVSVISIIIRYRHADETIRQQTKWFAFGVTPFVLGSIFLFVFQTQTSFGSSIFVTAGLISAPITIAIAIFRYRLYDIDIILNRILVYGTLTSLVIGFYLLAVGSIGLVVGTRDNLISLLLTAVVVLFFFKPIKNKIQAGVNRLTIQLGSRVPQTQPEQTNASATVHFSPGWLRVARIGWFILMVLAVAIFISALPGYLQRINSRLLDHAPQDSQVLTTLFFPLAGSLASLFSSALSLYLSWLLFRRKFENPAVAAVSFYLLGYGIIMTGPLEAWGTYWIGSSDFAINVQTLLMATPTVALLVLFPNGQFVPRWSRWVLIASLPWNLMAFFFPLFPYTGENTFSLAFQGIFWTALLGLGFYAQVVRYRRVSTLAERQQTKWVLFGFGLWIEYLILSSIPYFYLTSLPPGSAVPWWAPISELGWWLSLSIIPVTLTLAITRSRLWNIDIVINRALVYGTLTVATMGLYILVVGALGNLLHVGNSTFIAFLTTGLVAILFQPLRERLQGWVNRRMYGERDDPVAVLSRLGETLEHTGSPQDALERIAETVARALKLPYAAIQFEGGTEPVASFGIPRPEVLSFALVYQAETNGHLLVAPRAPGEAFNPSDLRLLENIAHQAGAAAHAARLTADLRHSRQRLVTAREEERRRIRRDLHDGLGPNLAGLTLRLDTLRNLLHSEPQRAEELLDEIKKQAQATIQDVRSLVYELRPPALDELGLVGAIRTFIDQHTAPQPILTLEVPAPLPPLPAALEAAAYRIVMEGLNNILRHASSNQGIVRLSLEPGHLLVEIHDDGVGAPSGFSSGVGLASMRERAEELGGSFEILPLQPGFHLRARLPFIKE